MAILASLEVDDKGTLIIKDWRQALTEAGEAAKGAGEKSKEGAKGHKEQSDALSRLTEDAKKAQQELVRQVQGFQLLAQQMKAGTVASQGQIAALQQLQQMTAANTAFTQKFGASLQQTITTLQGGGQVTAQMTAGLNSMAQSLAQGGQASNTFAQGMNNAATAARVLTVALGALSAGAMKQYLEKSFDIASRNQVLSTIMSVVSKNARSTGVEFELQAKKIQALGITTKEARDAVIQFAQAELNVADAAKIARAAQDLAVVAGLDSSAAFQRLTTAIQMTSPMMLRQFGIVKGLDQVYSDYAKSIGKSVSELDGAQKKQAFMNSILEEAAKVSGAYLGAMEDVGKQITSLVRLKEELTNKIGQALLPIMLKLVETFSDLLKWLGNLSPEWARLATAVMVGVAALLAAAAAITAVTMAATYLAPALAVLMGPWGLLALGVGAVAAAIVYFTSTSGSAYKATMEQVAATEAEAQGLMDLEKAMQKAYTNMVVLNSVTEAGEEGVKKRTEAQEAYEASLRKLEKVYPGIVSGEKDYSKQVDETEANIRKKIASYDALVEAHVEGMRKELAGLEVARDAGLARTDVLRAALDPKATTEQVDAAMNALTAMQATKYNLMLSLGKSRLAAFTDVVKAALKEQDASVEITITNIKRLITELDSLDPSKILDKARATKKEIEDLFKDKAGGATAGLKGLKIDPKTLVDLEDTISTFEKAQLTGESARVGARAAYDKAVQLHKQVTTAIEEDNKKRTAATEKWKKAEESAYESIANKQATFGANFVGVARALGEVGRGTEEYTARLLRAKGVIEQFNKLTEEQKKQFPALAKAAKDLEMVTLAQTFEKWNEKLREVVGTVREAASEMGNKFYEETLKRMVEADTKWADQQETLHRSAAKMEEELYEKTVVAKMSEVNQKLYAENKYTREFVQRIDDQIKALNRQMAEEQRAIDERNAAAERELAQVIRRAEQRFKVEVATVNAIKEAYTDLNEAISKGMTKDDWEKRIRNIKATFSQEMGNIYDAEMEKINALTAEEQAAYDKRYATSRAHVTRLETLQKQVVASGVKANASIVENHRKATDYLTLFWIDTFQQIASGFTKGFLQMLTGAKTFTDELIGIWNEMKRTFFKIADDMLQKWISTAFNIAKTGKVMTDSGEQSVTGGFFTRLYKGFASQISKLFTSNVAAQTASIAPAFAAAPAVQAAATGTTLASTSLAGYAALPGAGAAGGAAGGALGGAGGAAAAGGTTAMGVLSAGAVGAGVGGTVGWMTGKSTGSYVKGIGFGVGSGAAAGAIAGSILPGVGTAIGAGIGALAGLISGWLGASKARKEIEKARTKFIEDAGGLEALKEQAAEAGMSLDKLFNTTNPKEFNAEMKKVANALQVNTMIKSFEQLNGGVEGLKIRAQAAGISLDEMYKAGVGAEDLAKSLELIGAKLDLAKTKAAMWDLKKTAQLVGYDIRKLYDAKNIEEFNRQQAYLNKLLEQQQMRLQGLSRAAGGLEQMVAGLEMRIGKTIEEMTKGFSKEFKEKLEGAYKLAVERGYEGSQLKFLMDIKVNLSKEDQAKLAAMVKSAQKEFNTLGMVAAATFAGILRETGDLAQALNAIEPSMAKLAELQEALGLKAEGAFAKLLAFRKVVKDNEDIATSLSGIASVLRGLGDAGILTQEMFGEMGKSVSDMYQTLIDRGAGEQNAMLMSQASLQQLWQMQKDYGYTLDDNTQKLVDQAVEQGLVGDKFKDVNQKILDMLVAIGTALGAVIPEYLKVGDVTDDLGDRGEVAAERHRQKWAEAEEQARLYGNAMGDLDVGDVTGQLEDVEGAQGDVEEGQGGIQGSLDDSMDKWREWRDVALDACDDVYEAEAAVEHGHSPGGLTGITAELERSTAAFTVWKDSALASTGAVSQALVTGAQHVAGQINGSVGTGEAPVGDVVDPAVLQKVADLMVKVQASVKGTAEGAVLSKDLFEAVGVAVAGISHSIKGDPTGITRIEEVLINVKDGAKLSAEQIEDLTHMLAQAAEAAGPVAGEIKGELTGALDALVSNPAIPEVIDRFLKVGKAAQDAADKIAIIEGVSEDVSDGMGETGDAQEGVRDNLAESEDAFLRWRDTAVAAAEEVYDAVNAVAVGHSPGGLAGVTDQAQIALEAFDDFADGAGKDLEKIEAALKELASLQHQAVSAQLSGAQKSLYDLGFQQQQALESWMEKSEDLSQDQINAGINAINARFSAEVWNIRNEQARQQAEATKAAMDTLEGIQNAIVESSMYGLQLALHQLDRERADALESWMEQSAGQQQSMIQEGIAAINRLYDIKEVQAGAPGGMQAGGEWLDPLYADWRKALGAGYSGSLTQFLSERGSFESALTAQPGQEQSAGNAPVPSTLTYEDTVPLVIQVDGEVLTRIVLKRTGRVLNQYGV